MILIVDDERLVCDLLRTVLSRRGHEIAVATSGQEAIRLFKKLTPQVTILDILLPDINGIDVLKEIRAYKPDASVMMLTCVESEQLEREARALGITDFFRKGLSLDVVMKALEREVQRSSRKALSKPAAPGSADSRREDSILVVDDEPMIREMLSRFLILRRYRVRTAQNGKEALAMVEQESPNLIIMDMYMPGMNGVETLRRLRANQYRGGVIALTASQDEDLLQQTLDLGSVDVMGKPVDLQRLELAVQVALVMSSS